MLKIIVRLSMETSEERLKTAFRKTAIISDFWL